MKNLKKLRQQNNISQEQLSKVINVSRNTVSQYETGVREPTFKTLFQLADYFNVSIDYLLGYSATLQEVNNNKVNTLPDYQQEVIDLVLQLDLVQCSRLCGYIEHQFDTILKDTKKKKA